ncbi:hypothetical protein [Burkholderia sp. RF4-BP95]|uniref:hypothetical protein n=1 Tax=Burkholderia sp. RF4-BP95 TaxID=1637845 RepID=UPI0012E3DE32|nr:hypothetical protein [Burkholderia sp. RF4-BP95]
MRRNARGHTVPFAQRCGRAANVPLDARRVVGIEIREAGLRGAKARVELRVVCFAEQRAADRFGGRHAHAFVGRGCRPEVERLRLGHARGRRTGRRIERKTPGRALGRRIELEPLRLVGRIRHRCFRPSAAVFRTPGCRQSDRAAVRAHEIAEAAVVAAPTALRFPHANRMHAADGQDQGKCEQHGDRHDLECGTRRTINDRTIAAPLGCRWAIRRAFLHAGTGTALRPSVAKDP